MPEQDILANLKQLPDKQKAILDNQENILGNQNLIKQD